MRAGPCALAIVPVVAIVGTMVVSAVVVAAMTSPNDHNLRMCGRHSTGECDNRDEAQQQDFQTCHVLSRFQQCSLLLSSAIFKNQ